MKAILLKFGVKFGEFYSAADVRAYAGVVETSVEDSVCSASI
jgi:hypothetical protein